MELESGARGRTRTDTTFYGPRILSPVRLPFRHTGSERGQYPEADWERQARRGNAITILPALDRKHSRTLGNGNEFLLVAHFEVVLGSSMPRELLYPPGALS